MKTARASLKDKIAFTVSGVNLKKLDLKCPQHHTNLWLTQRKDEFGATIVTIFCMKCKKKRAQILSYILNLFRNKTDRIIHERYQEFL